MLSRSATIVGVGVALWPAVARAACPADVASLTERVQAAEAAPSDEFPALRLEVQAEVACLEEIVTPELAAGVHRVEALSAYVQRDMPAVVRAFRAAVALDPGWEPPERFGEGHPLRELHARAVSAPDGPVLAIEGAGAWVDGREATDRTADRPAVFQWVDDGQVEWSGYLREAQVPPARVEPESEPAPAPVEEPEPLPTEPPRKRPVALASATAVVAVGTGVLWAASLSTRASVLATEIPRDADSDLQAAIERKAGRANALGFAAQAGTAATVVLGTVTVVRW